MPEAAHLKVVVSADTAQAEAGLARVHSALEGLPRVAQGALSTFVGFASAQLALSGLGQAFSAAQNAVIGFNASLEQSRIAWTTMLRSGETAQAFLLELQQFAAKTPFEFPDVERGARRLLAMGFAAADVLPMLRDIGNAAAGLGAGSEGVNRLTIALGQMQAKGKVSAEELLQLSELGVNINEIFSVLAQQTGKTVDELRKMQEQGQLTSDVFIKAFQQWSQANFGDMMEQQSRTFNGALSTITDTVRLVTATAFGPLFRRLSDLAVAIADFVSSDQFMEWGARVAAVIDVVLEGLGVLAAGFADVLSAIAETVITLGGLIFEALQLLNPFAPHSPPLVDQVRDGMDIILAEFNRLGLAVSSIEEVGDALEGLASPIRDLGPDLERLGDSAETAKAGLQGLKDRLETARDATRILDEAVRDAQRTIEDLARAPIKGTEEFDDRLFDLQQRINRVQLQLVNLRLSGAPKDQIKALEQELDRLRLHAEAVRLEKSITLDPLRRQIEKLARPVRELTFEEIVQGIQEQQEKLAQLVPLQEKAHQVQAELTAAVRAAERAFQESARSGGARAVAQSVSELKDKLKGLDVSRTQEELSALRERMTELRDSLRSQLMPTLEGIRDSLSTVASFIRGLNSALQESPGPVREASAGLLAFVGIALALNTVVGLVLRLVSAFSLLIPVITGAGSVAGGIVAVLGGPLTIAIIGVAAALAALYLAWQTNFLGLRGPIESVVGTIANILGTVLGGAISTVGSVIGEMVSTAGELLEIFTGFWGRNAGRVERIVEALGRTVNSVMASGLGGLLGLVTQYWNQVASVISTVSNVITTVISLAWKIIKSLVLTNLRNILDGIEVGLALLTGDWEGAMQAVQRIVDRNLSLVRSAFESAISWARDRVNELRGFFDSILGIGRQAQERPAGGGGGVGTGGPETAIPEMQAGGIVTRPTLALLGEAGPEAVIPLNRAGGFGITVAFNAPVIGSVELRDARDAGPLAEQVREAVLQALRQALLAETRSPVVGLARR